MLTNFSLLGHEFHKKQVAKSDLELLFKINTIGFDFYNKIPIQERKKYTISYDIHLKNKNGKTYLVHKKLTPLFLADNGKLWKSVCIVSLSTQKTSGNIKIAKEEENKIFTYDLKKNLWKSEEKIELCNREKEIIRFSFRGFTIKEMAEAMFVCVDTVKFYRKKIFNKLRVNNITEAIIYVTNNKLI